MNDRYLYSGADPSWSEIYRESKPAGVPTRVAQGRRFVGPTKFRVASPIVAGVAFAIGLDVLVAMNPIAPFDHRMEGVPGQVTGTTLGVAFETMSSRANDLDSALASIEAGFLPPVPVALAALVRSASGGGAIEDVDAWAVALADDIASADSDG